MKREWKIATVLGSFAMACGLYAWGIPAVVNLPAHKNFIENKIYETSGYKVDIGNPKLSMGWFPSVWIQSDNISLFNYDNTKVLSVDNPKLKLRLLPLLSKKIEITNLSATREYVNFVFKDSDFYIGQYKLEPPKSPSEFKLAKMNLNIGEYNILLDDKNNNQKVSLNGLYFRHGKYIQNKQMQFATEAVFNSGKKSANIFADVDINLPIDRLSEDKLRIDAQINNFDLASISDYVSSLSGGKIKSLSGFVSFNADTVNDNFGHKKVTTRLETDNLKIIGADRASSIIYDDKLTADVNFLTVDNGIMFENTELNADKLHAKVNGKIFDLGHKEPKYDVEAEVYDTRIENAVAILPGSEKLLPDFNLYKLKKYVFYGDGQGKLKFKGKGIKPNVTGEVKLRDAYLIKPIKGANANASIDLKFIGQKMLLNVFVPTTNNQSVTVKGNVLLDGSKYSELNIKSTDSVLLEPAREVLVPLHEILKFQLGPVPLMNIAGIGNIDLRSSGTKLDPHIWGNFNFRDVILSFIDINNLELHKGAGEVLFDDKKITFKSTQAFIDGKPVEVNGDCVILGKLNVYVTSKSQDIKKLIKAVNSSPLLVDIQKVVKPFTKPDGTADLFIHVYGLVKDAEEMVFNQDLFAKGTIKLHNAKTVMQDTYLPFTGVNGIVNFDQYNSDYDVTGNVRQSNVHVWGTGTNSQINLKAHSDKLKLADVFELLHPDMVLPYKKEIGEIYTSFNASYNGKAEAGKIDYNKISVDGKIISNMTANNPIKTEGGTFTIKNGLLSTSNLKGLFNNNPFALSFVMNNIDKGQMSIAQAKYNFKNFDLSSISTIKNQIKLPKELASQIDNIANVKGNIDISGSISNNNINADTNLKSVSFVYKPFDAVVKIINGNANIRGNVLYLDKINSTVSSMPVFLNGKISNIYQNPNLNLFISSKLTQNFFDRFYNSKAVYPVKIKGDINFYTRLNGVLNSLNAKSNLNLAENASIYYMGATIAGAPTGTLNSDGMTTNPVSVISDIILYPNRLRVNSLNYNQTITSQNKKKSEQNQVSMSGDLYLLKDKIVGFKNFKIKTANPTNARIFNVLFKKPTIKQGVFTTDLLINGTSEIPYILGFLNIKSVDIPLFNSTVRDINLDFQKDYINLDSKSIVLTNDILMQAKIVNNLVKPIRIEDINIQMDELDLNVVASSISDLEADSTRKNRNKSDENTQLFAPDTVIIKNAQINADNVLIKKAQAKNFKSHITLGSEQKLRIDNYSFDIANGTVDGNIVYDLKNLKGDADMNINNADAQIIAENFFDMTGQVYGIVTGKLNASCSGITSVDCVNTLSGSGDFEVIDGRMPKLGSLEYLLKAGNLITGGVTGVSINGIIDLITPLKTGNFNSISGNVHVENGVADDINVYSNGNDLNMYMTGSYNLSTLVADMEVYGSLSKNISTLLGRIGNTSLNTLFNTIPGVKINEINPKSTSNINKIPNFDKSNILRVFKAEIYGDINGNNYVKSFRWIKD
ncbi:hypothetical protein IJ541_08900 [bacterium]|nr:hypothetical protein [bacterium]MBQ9245998.1 hypothetical protein [bacterium]MBQ9246899.1 hypothetical protein [bacterium]